MAARRKPARKSTPPEARARQRLHTRPRPCKRCAVSARRRNCRGPSLSGEDFLEKTLEARIASQWIENRIDFDFKREPVAFFDGLCQPGEGLLLITQPH